MTDDPDGTSETPEPDSFQSWVASLSETTGATREEVLEQLVSSYWTLNELLGVIEDSGDDGDLRPPTGDGSALDPPVPPVDSGDDEVTAEALAERVDALAARLDDLETDPDDSDGTGADGDGPESVEALAERSERRWSALSERHESLRSRVDAEFGNLDAVLSYLIETTDELAARTDRLLADRETELRRRRAERRALAGLKREAAGHGVTKARCDHCDETVQLAALATPRCPHCASVFDGVVPRTGLLEFGPSRLTVSAEEDPLEPGDDAPVGDDEFRWLGRDLSVE